MMKKLLVLLACLSLAFQITGCTSKNNQDDAEVAADYDSADLEKIEGDEALEAGGTDSLASDQLPEDALGETTATTETTAETPAPTSTDQPAESTNDIVASSETLPADPFAESTSSTPATDVTQAPVDTSTSVVDSTPSVVDSSSMADISSSTTVVDSATEEPPKKASAPLQKVATTPWKVGKTWFNTVYFARPGDSLAGISQMIYGADKRKELKKGNPIFSSRDVRPGDKVYYNSPHRPDDSAKLITYYEDNGVAPEVYVAKAGDNIRTVSKEILGYDNAWKEVWSSNAVDSKGEIAEGTELRYWKGGGVAAAPAAPVSQEIPPHQELATSMPQEPAIPAQTEQLPPQVAQQDEIPAPPPAMDEQAGTEMAPPPPPPQDLAQDQMAPPPPPPPVEAVNPPAPQMAEESLEEGGSMDNDTTMALGVVGIAAAGLAGLIVVRKKRKQRELEIQGMDNTHVGT